MRWTSCQRATSRMKPADTQSPKADRRRWYFVCPSCNAKWFAARAAKCSVRAVPRKSVPQNDSPHPGYQGPAQHPGTSKSQSISHLA